MGRALSIIVALLMTCGMLVSPHLNHIQKQQISNAQSLGYLPLSPYNGLETFGSDSIDQRLDYYFDRLLESCVGVVTPGGITDAQFETLQHDNHPCDPLRCFCMTLRIHCIVLIRAIVR